MNAKTTVNHERAECVDELTASTLKSALMQITLDELKNALDVWQRISEHEQDAVLQRLDQRVSGATRQAIELFATSGIARVKATMEQITIKDGIKAVLSLSRFDAQRHEVVDAQGQTVYIVLANPEQFTDAPHEHKPDADQQALDLDKNLKDVGDSDDAQPA